MLLQNIEHYKMYRFSAIVKKSLYNGGSKRFSIPLDAPVICWFSCSNTWKICKIIHRCSVKFFPNIGRLLSILHNLSFVYKHKAPLLSCKCIVFKADFPENKTALKTCLIFKTANTWLQTFSMHISLLEFGKTVLSCSPFWLNYCTYKQDMNTLHVSWPPRSFL